jgi:hypothetical protein
VEKFLRVRGLLEPSGGAFGEFENKKDQQENMFVTGSSFIQKQIDQQTEDNLNSLIAEAEKHHDVEDLQGATVNYKDLLIESARKVLDPFAVEIGKELNYGQNPADPTKLLRTIDFLQKTA